MADSSYQFKLPSISDDNHLPYNVHDYYSVFEWLKQKAMNLSDMKWSDFTEGSIGAVQLHLLSYLADMLNFHVDKQTAELYLSTAVERSTLITMAEMMAFYPKHYISGSTKLVLSSLNNDMYGLVLPAFHRFYSSSETVTYYNIKPYKCMTDNIMEVEVYEGEYQNVRYYFKDIDDYGRIYLNHFNIGFNTVVLNLDNIDIDRSENSLYSKQPLTFSIHCSPEQRVYIQLPPIWRDVINENSQIYVSYLTTKGSLSNIGAGVIDRVYAIPGQLSEIQVLQEEPIVNGRNPQSIDELKVSIPEHARTMDTFITLNDYSSRILENIPSIIDVLALDYTIEGSGLVQPEPPNGAINDAFKVKLCALPASGSIYLGSHNTEASIKTANNQMYLLPGDTFALEGISQTFTVTDADQNGKLKAFSPTNFLTNEDNTGDYNIIPLATALDSNNNLMKLTISNGGNRYLVGDVLLMYLPDKPESRFSVTVEATDNNGAITKLSNCHLASTALATGSYTYTPVNGSGEGVVISATVVPYPSSTTKTKISVTSTVIPPNLRTFSTIGKQLDEYVQAHRPAGTYIIYEEVEKVAPDIVIDLYLDVTSENFAIIEDMVINFLKETYSSYTKTPEKSINNRPDFHIGSPIYATKIAQQVMDNFEEIEYAVCRIPEEKLEVGISQYIDFQNANYTIRKNYQP